MATEEEEAVRHAVVVRHVVEEELSLLQRVQSERSALLVLVVVLVAVLVLVLVAAADDKSGCHVHHGSEPVIAGKSRH